MLRIVYDQEPIQTADGSYQLQLPPIDGQITISPDVARRTANGYLARYVALTAIATDPALVWQAEPMWRMSVNLQLPGLGNVAKLGEIEVSAISRKVAPLSFDMIQQMQQQAANIVTRLTSTTN